MKRLQKQVGFANILRLKIRNDKEDCIFGYISFRKNCCFFVKIVICMFHARQVKKISRRLLLLLSLIFIDGKKRMTIIVVCCPFPRRDSSSMRNNKCNNKISMCKHLFRSARLHWHNTIKYARIPASFFLSFSLHHSKCVILFPLHVYSPLLFLLLLFSFFCCIFIRIYLTIS